MNVRGAAPSYYFIAALGLFTIVALNLAEIMSKRVENKEISKKL